MTAAGNTPATLRHRFVALDSLRGVAAIGVVLYHFGDVGLISSLPLFRHGYIFVDFFFVLSGFVIAAAYGDLLARGFSRATFMALRLGRVYPLHIVVVAGFVLAQIASGRPLLEGSGSIGYLMRAVFLLDGYFPDDLNFYNAASWSISVELAAYVLAALLFGRGRWGMSIACFIWGIAVWGYLAEINALVFSALLQRGVIGFGIGAVAWATFARLAPNDRWRWSTPAEMALLLIAGSLIPHVGADGWGLLICDLAFAAVVIVFAHEGGAMSRLLAARPMQALGRWSYSIYLNHLLILMIAGYGLRMALERAGRSDLLRLSGTAGLERIDFGLWGNTALTLIVASLVIAVSALTFRFIEEPARRWSRRRAAAFGHGERERIAPTF